MPASPMAKARNATSSWGLNGTWLQRVGVKRRSRLRQFARYGRCVTPTAVRGSKECSEVELHSPVTTWRRAFVTKDEPSECKITSRLLLRTKRLSR